MFGTCLRVSGNGLSLDEIISWDREDLAFIQGAREFRTRLGRFTCFVDV